MSQNPPSGTQQQPVNNSYASDGYIAVATYIQQHGVAGLNKYARDQLDSWKKIPLNIAVTGRSGVGKSTFINTVRMLGPEDEGAAVVSVVEGTRVPTAYVHPHHTNLIFWDLPGVGTENFPHKTYLSQVNYEKYDFFLIICKSRFTEDDIWLAQEVIKQKKKFFFVRTQIDVDLRNARRDHPHSFDGLSKLNRLRSDCEHQFLSVKEGGNIPSVYAISGLLIFDRQWDFPRLMDDLLTQYPDLKRHAMALAISSNCSQIIKTKVNELKKRKWVVATLSAGVAAIPVPLISVGFDLTACTAEAEFYRDQLGLSHTNLHKLADIHKIPFELLKQELDSILPESLLPLVVQIAKSLAAVSVGEEASRFIPLVGSIIASTLSFGGTLFILDNMLNTMEQAALKVNDLIVSSSQVL